MNWGSGLSDKSLFDLNGKGIYLCCNIKFNYQGTISTGNAAPTVNIFTSTVGVLSGGGGNNRQLTISRCQSFSSISSFLISTDPDVDFGKVVIDQCDVSAIYDTALTITGSCLSSHHTL